MLDYALKNALGLVEFREDGEGNVDARGTAALLLRPPLLDALNVLGLLHLAGQALLIVGGEEAHLPDLAEVHANRIVTALLVFQGHLIRFSIYLHLPRCQKFSGLTGWPGPCSRQEIGKLLLLRGNLGETYVIVVRRINEVIGARVAQHGAPEGNELPIFASLGSARHPVCHLSWSACSLVSRALCSGRRYTLRPGFMSSTRAVAASRARSASWLPGSVHCWTNLASFGRAGRSGFLLMLGQSRAAGELLHL
jgi:hypothetical protein